MPYEYPELHKAQQIARQFGFPIPHSSQRKNKKLYVNYNGKEIHFGYRKMEDYLQHKDGIRREKFRARARGIMNKSGYPAYKDITSPLFWTYRILW